PGFHLYEALCRCSDWLEGFGGHACAAGLSIKADRIEDFAARFADLAQELVTEEMRVPNLDYDVEGALSQLDFETVAELKRLAPFGFGNPEPVLRVRQARACNLRPVGREHLKLSLQQGDRRIDAIAFGMASQAERMQGELDFLCSPQVNTWKGRSSVQLRIRDFKPSA
ncbi:MAG: single-stranded-DNA-specific exonuclease RecJ, partial [Geoalkalibacter sp.]